MSLTCLATWEQSPNSKTAVTNENVSPPNTYPLVTCGFPVPTSQTGPLLYGNSIRAAEFLIRFEYLQCSVLHQKGRGYVTQHQEAKDCKASGIRGTLMRLVHYFAIQYTKCQSESPPRLVLGLGEKSEAWVRGLGLQLARH